LLFIQFTLVKASKILHFLLPCPANLGGAFLPNGVGRPCEIESGLLGSRPCGNALLKKPGEYLNLHRHHRRHNAVILMVRCAEEAEDGYGRAGQKAGFPFQVHAASCC
jgi:hypothetical protein